eukprot:COSAG02_NODE_19_length_53976_cov_37.338512_22_plen_164_part_00
MLPAKGRFAPAHCTDSASSPSTTHSFALAPPRIHFPPQCMYPSGIHGAIWRIERIFRQCKVNSEHRLHCRYPSRRISSSYATLSSVESVAALCRVPILGSERPPDANRQAQPLEMCNEPHCKTCGCADAARPADGDSTHALIRLMHTMMHTRGHCADGVSGCT